MRWRILDRMESFEPWQGVTGTKAASLEECNLLAPLGRNGAFPESLVLESCVELGRWLVAVSSEFSLTAVLREVHGFKIERHVCMGDVLRISILTESRGRRELQLQCRVCCEGECAAQGRIGIEFLPLAEHFDPEVVRVMWGELYGAA